MITTTIRVVWLALWNTRLLQEIEKLDKQMKKNSTCTINMENMALAILHECQEIDNNSFRLLLYLSLSYILGGILLLVGIDAIGRKICLGKYL